MNIGGFGSNNAAPAQPAGPSAITMAKVEVQMYTEMFNKMTALCFKKCRFNYSDSDLSVGEMSCIDRCAGKYMQAHQSIGETMERIQQQMGGQPPQ